jgi:hypothetical protein
MKSNTYSNLLDFLYLVVYSTQKLLTEFLKFSLPPFYMALEVEKIKENKHDNKK